MDGYSQNFSQTIAQAQQRASGLASGAGQLASELPNVGELLRQKSQQAYNQNQDIVKPLDEKTATYLASPQVAREQYQGIFNPFSREKLVAQYIQNQSLPMLSLSNILGNRMGRIQDMIGAGTSAFQAQVLAEQARAEQAQREVETLLRLYGMESDQLNANRDYELRKQAADRAAAGSGLNLDLGSFGNQFAQPAADPLEYLLEPDAPQENNSVFGLRAPVSQQIPALPQAGFEIGLPKSFGEVGQRLGAWGNTLLGGLTGNYGFFK